MNRSLHGVIALSWLLVLGALGALGGSPLGGCAATDDEASPDEDLLDKGEESAVPDLDAVTGAGGKNDSFARPTNHGPLLGRDTTDMSPDARHHTWTFEVLRETRVVLLTLPAGFEAEIDTVLYLYQRRANGRWGSAIARNDDAALARPQTKLSRLERTLRPGTYRVLVKGYRATTEGPFDVSIACATPGACLAAPAGTCLFGRIYRDALESPRVRLVNREELRQPARLSPGEEAQIVAALHASAHDDVTTVAEAFARVDGGVINRVLLWDPPSARTFVAYEYGAGDNSYGAIFVAGATATASPVALIQDGDLKSCRAGFQTCVLGRHYREIAPPAFTVVAQTVVTATTATALDARSRRQLVRAAKEANPEVSSPSAALAAADRGQINRTELRHRTTGATFVAYELGAGDTSVGVVFHAGSRAGELDIAAVISDGSLDSCSALDPASIGAPSAP